jgi:hypothetical protein
VSVSLATKIDLGLEELSTVRDQFSPLVSLPADANVGVIETAAACAMLHSFYTEIEKILKLIARDLDRQLPSSDTWHRDLLNQAERVSPSASARWTRRGTDVEMPETHSGPRREELSVAKVDETYSRTRFEILSFLQWLRGRDAAPE